MRERRASGPYASVRNLYERVALDREVLEALARSGAFDGFSDRREALYPAAALRHAQPVGVRSLFDEVPEPPPFPPLDVLERVVWDYQLKGLTEHLVHPVDLVRRELLDLGAQPTARLPRCGYVTTAGLVVARQKPPTAKGFALFVPEDNVHRVQVLLSPALWEQHHEALRDASLLLVEGLLESEGHAWTLRADALCPIVVPMQVGEYRYA